MLRLLSRLLKSRSPRGEIPVSSFFCLLNLFVNTLTQASHGVVLLKLCRKKPKSKEPNAKRAKVEKGKKAKDPNMPKRPPTAFFVFL